MGPFLKTPISRSEDVERRTFGATRLSEPLGMAPAKPLSTSPGAAEPSRPLAGRQGGLSNETDWAMASGPSSSCRHQFFERG